MVLMLTQLLIASLSSSLCLQEPPAISPVDVLRPTTDHVAMIRTILSAVARATPVSRMVSVRQLGLSS